MNSNNIELKYDKNMPNTLEIKVYGESHSLGSSLSEKMVKDSRTIFSSYKVDHPMHDYMYIKVGADSSVSVKKLIIYNLKEIEIASQDLINQVNDYHP